MTPCGRPGASASSQLLFFGGHISRLYNVRGTTRYLLWRARALRRDSRSPHSRVTGRQSHRTPDQLHNRAVDLSEICIADLYATADLCEFAYRLYDPSVRDVTQGRIGLGLDPDMRDILQLYKQPNHGTSYTEPSINRMVQLYAASSPVHASYEFLRTACPTSANNDSRLSLALV